MLLLVFHDEHSVKTVLSVREKYDYKSVSMNNRKSIRVRRKKKVIKKGGFEKNGSHHTQKQSTLTQNQLEKYANRG